MSQVYPSGTTTPGNQRFVSGYNSSGSSIAVGSMVVWDTADADGYGFTLPVTAMGGLMAGILTETVAKSANTDKIQCRGVVDALVDGTTDVTIGDSMKPVNASPNLVKDAAGAMSADVQAVTALEARTTDSAALTSVYVNLPG